MKNKLIGAALATVLTAATLCGCSLVQRKVVVIKNTSAPTAEVTENPDAPEETSYIYETEVPDVSTEPEVTEAPTVTESNDSKATEKPASKATEKASSTQSAKTTAVATATPAAKTTAKASATAKATTAPNATQSMQKLSVTPAPRTSSSHSDYYNSLIAKGFTAVYAERLEALHQEHPNWTFEPVLITSLSRTSSYTKNGSAYTWDYVVQQEYGVAGRNLVTTSSWAPSAYASLGQGNYTPYYDTTNTKLYDSGYRQASKAAIEYFMDPRNFLNEYEIFMFQAISYNSSADTSTNVAKVLSGSFMGNNAKVDNGQTYADYITSVGAKYKVSALNLALRLVSEHGGEGNSPLVVGTTGTKLYYYATSKPTTDSSKQVWGSVFTSSNVTSKIAEDGYTVSSLKNLDGYYNFFDINAAGDGCFAIYYNAMKEAVEGGWTSQAKAIDGGAAKYASKYVDCCQDTVYFQKFNVNPNASRDGKNSSNFWGQYMQSISTAVTESRSLHSTYEEAGILDVKWVFKIPVYEGMPTNPCADPGNGKCYYSAHEVPTSNSYAVYDAYSDCTFTMLNGAAGSYSSDACWCVTRKTTDSPTWPEIDFGTTINTSYYKYCAVFGEATGAGNMGFYTSSGSISSDQSFSSGAVILKFTTKGMTNSLRLPVYGNVTKFYYNKFVFYNTEEDLRDYIYDSGIFTIDSTKTSGNTVTCSGWTAQRSMVESYGYIINGYVGYSDSFKITPEAAVKTAGASNIGRTGDIWRYSITATRSSGQTVTFVVKLKYFDVPFIISTVK